MTPKLAIRGRLKSKLAQGAGGAESTELEGLGGLPISYWIFRTGAGFERGGFNFSARSLNQKRYACGRAGAIVLDVESAKSRSNRGRLLRTRAAIRC